MLTRKFGKILNVAATASKTPGTWQPVYHGTQGVVLSFIEAIPEELIDMGITVTAKMPRFTDAAFFDKADMKSSRAVQDPDAKAVPSDVAKDGFEALNACSIRPSRDLKSRFKPQSAISFRNQYWLIKGMDFKDRYPKS